MDSFVVCGSYFLGRQGCENFHSLSVFILKTGWILSPFKACASGMPHKHSDGKGGVPERALLSPRTVKLSGLVSSELL